MMSEPCPPPVPNTFALATCADPSVLRPVVPTHEGKPVPQSQLAVRCFQGQKVSIDWTFRHDSGRPVDLAACGDGSSSSSGSSGSSAVPGVTYKMKLREGARGVQDPIKADGVVDGSTVRFTLPTNATALNGVYRTHVAVLGADGHPRMINQFYLIVDRSDFAKDFNARGCPTVADVRTNLRDSGPNDNYLLAALEYELGEVAYAMIRAVSDWNSFLPGIGPRYDTTNFGDPETLTFGIVGYLYEGLAHSYRRNHLAYQAAGVAVDDKNREAEYTKAGEASAAIYDRWVKQQKARANKEAFTGSAWSPYRWVSRPDWGGW